ncbi:MAG: hypothetical protein KIS66_12880 [Fimbriimonadaceae bacterium]|nr:hypothetical protein [Fimbriimonadaceae bacterium]
MAPFPHLDPIPIPAPVWLMKALSLITLALHFSAVMIVVGSLLLVLCLNATGRRRRSEAHLSASYTLAKRLPVIMTWVINLGVPPLLFAQVLYGPAIYSSSVLIGVLWFSVIPLLMLAYWLMYRTVAAFDAKRSPAWQAFFALLVVLGIGQIYAMNMTLMLRPEAWQAMYKASPLGLKAPTGDPTTTLRWLFVMAGGPLFGGVWALLLSNMAYLTPGVQAALRRVGGWSALLGAALQGVLALRIVHAQPKVVGEALAGNTLFTVGGYAFLVTAALVALLGAFQALRGRGNVVIGTAGLLLAFVANAGSVVARDAIRDATLKAKGFDVWNRVESSNWSVVDLFLLLFVVMLGTVYWLLSVMRKATPPSEQVTL